jgi:CxxC-x17-CxxC domain-containing protein
MEFQDKTLTCVECGQPFVFTAGEQEFFAQKGFQNAPKRCKACKATKRAGERSAFPNPAAGAGPAAPRELHDVVCSSCGQKTTVPFRPTSDRPVYCRACFQARRGAGVRPV